MSSKNRRSNFPWWQGKLIIMVLSFLGLGFIANVMYPKTHQAIYEKNTSAPALFGKVSCILDHVIDGDTVIASCDKYLKMHLRLSGIDAPESAQEPWGEDSRKALQAILPRKFTIIANGKEYYQRQLATLYDGNKDLNLVMLEKGQAVIYNKSSAYPAYLAAQQKAQQQKLGIWSKPGMQQRPKDWRRYHAK